MKNRSRNKVTDKQSNGENNRTGKEIRRLHSQRYWKIRQEIQREKF